MIIPKNKIFKELKDCPGKEIKIDNITPERYFALEEGLIYDRFLDKVLSSHINTGYNRVTLRMDDNSQKSYYVHVLVACTYLGDFRQDKTVNHENGNKQHNYVSNLKWLTHHENITHAIENNLIKNRTALTEQVVHNVCKLIASGESISNIITKTGVCKSTVESIKYKEIWKHISVLYIFPERRYYNVTSEETMELLIEELTRVRIPDFNAIALKYNINLTTLASIYKRKVVKATHDKIYGII